MGTPVRLKTAGGGSWAKGGSGESAPGKAALLPRRPPGPIPGEREAARLPRPRADSARRLPDPWARPRPPGPSVPVRPHRPPPAHLTQRASAAYSPRLRALLAPQATSGFAGPGHGARDRRRGVPARAYSAAAGLAGAAVSQCGRAELGKCAGPPECGKVATLAATGGRRAGRRSLSLSREWGGFVF